MKKIRVVATNQRRILTVACASDMPRLLEKNEIIEGQWFYAGPPELDEFFEANPNSLEYFLEGFSYWIMSKVKGFSEDQNRYGKLKQEIHHFSKKLFTKLRNLASVIANEVKKVIKPKKARYDEARKIKKMYQKLTAQPIGAWYSIE